MTTVTDSRCTPANSIVPFRVALPGTDKIRPDHFLFTAFTANDSGELP